MPELPEVETIKLGLQKKIVGLTINRIEVRSLKSFIGKTNELKNKKIVNVWRKAKMLGIEVSDGMTLLFHLKMTGQLVYDDGQRPALPGASRGRFIGGHPTPDMRDQMPNNHTRVIFEFSNGSHLYFNDQRKFGWVKVIKNNELRIMNNGLFGKLGPEPLDKNFTWQILKSNLLNHKSQPVKVAIIDQTVVSGVGNIYSNEACFDAKIDPRIKVRELSDNQFQSLHRGVLKALRDGIKHGGSSRAHFVDSEGHKGYFLDYAFVYGRDKKPCKKCGTEIKKITLGNRGTYFCEKCQG